MSEATSDKSRDESHDGPESRGNFRHVRVDTEWLEPGRGADTAVERSGCGLSRPIGPRVEVLTRGSRAPPLRPEIGVGTGTQLP